MVQNNDGEAERPLLTNQEEPEYGTTRADPTPKPGAFQRNLGAIEAFAIIISIVIGSGIFTSPGSIDANVPSPGAALLIWLVGGVLAWTGASTLAELGTAIPGEGLLR
jgi:amino acid permease